MNVILTNKQKLRLGWSLWSMSDHYIPINMQSVNWLHEISTQTQERDIYEMYEMQI